MSAGLTPGIQRSLSDGRRADSRQFLSGFDRKRSQFAVIEIRSDPDIFESRHFVGDVPFALDVSVIFDLDFGFFDHFLRTPVFKMKSASSGRYSASPFNVILLRKMIS